MKQVFVENSTLFIYHEGINDSNMPKSAIKLAAGEYEKILVAPSLGKIFTGVGSDGVAVFAETEKESTDDLLARAKADIRSMRAPMLDALTGISGRAERSGNSELAAEADALAVLLLDITDDPTLNAATTYEEMQAAGVAAYKRIAAAASPALSIVFREITGA